MVRRAVYCGSFDPLTVGHWKVIYEGVKLFDELIVAIGTNPNKKPMFTAEERRDMIVETIKEYDSFGSLSPHIKVDVFEDEFLVKYAQRQGADYVLRGIRDSEDFRQEQAYHAFNRKFGSGIQTVFLMPDPEFSVVSSSAIKGMIGPKGWQVFVSPFVTTPVYKKLIEKFGDES